MEITFKEYKTLNSDLPWDTLTGSEEFVLQSAYTKGTDIRKYLELVDKNTNLFSEYNKTILNILETKASDNILNKYINGEISTEKTNKLLYCIKNEFSEQEANTIVNNLDDMHISNDEIFKSMVNTIKNTPKPQFEIPEEKTFKEHTQRRFKKNEDAILKEYEEAKKDRTFLEKIFRKMEDPKIDLASKQINAFGIMEAYYYRNNNNLEIDKYDGLQIAEITNSETKQATTIITGPKNKVEALAELLGEQKNINYDKEDQCFVVINKKDVIHEIDCINDKIILELLLKLQKEDKSMNALNDGYKHMTINLNSKVDSERINEVILANKKLFKPAWIIANIDHLNIGIAKTIKPIYIPNIGYNFYISTNKASIPELKNFEIWYSHDVHKKNMEYFSKQMMKEVRAFDDKRLEDIINENRLTVEETDKQCLDVKKEER